MMKQYFLLNQYPKPDSLHSIWKICSPRICALFDHTILSNYKEQGPVLLSGHIEKLVAEYKANPQSWPGLLINTNAAEDILVKHLRSLLLVTYPPESKGVLTYYDTHIAYYLFYFTKQEDLGKWLGPINSLQWYGGTWQQQANNQLQWLEVKQLDYRNKTPIMEYSHLTKEQQQGLLMARQHKYVYDWSITNKQDFDQILMHLQEAIQLNFDELQYLKQYLELRVKYPQQLIPAQLASSDHLTRLASLKNLWHGI